MASIRLVNPILQMRRQNVAAQLLHLCIAYLDVAWLECWRMAHSQIRHGVERLPNAEKVA